MSAVLKRVAWLNRSGALTCPLRYSQVKSVLESVGEESALQILAGLEAEASNISDPVDYIKKAADEILGSSGKAAAEEAESETNAGAAAGKKRKLASGNERSSESGVLAKRVRLLNSSGRLAKPIQFERVCDPLGSVGTAQAMTILKALEDSGSGVRDPTAYIRAAVFSSGGTVQADAFDVAAEEADAAMDEVVTPSKIGNNRAPPVKREGVVKREAGGAGGFGVAGVNARDFTETERIERRIQWLNRKSGLTVSIVLDEVLPALDSIGFRQAMRVLKRLEESAATVSDPNEFIRDSVARAGWIWAKSDVVDDDEKVAKRVAWLNQFGGLRQPVDWVEVADVLDDLRVPHAMVVLRELEVNAATVENPTDWIKKAIDNAGYDQVAAPTAGGNDESAISQRVGWLNEHGGLATQIDFSDVGDDLGRIKEKDAMQILQEVEDKAATVKDPTGYIRFKLKAKLAALGAPVAEEDDDTKILKRIEWLNDYGGLQKDIDFNRVSAQLGVAGIEHAMTILKELEDKRADVTNPTSFILSSLAASQNDGWQQPSAGGRNTAGARRASSAPGANSDLATLSSLIDLLSRRVKKQVKLADVASALDSLGPRAAQVLQEMQDKGLGLDDPVQYIKAVAQRKGGGTKVKAEGDDVEDENDDDVAKITKRIQWLNKFGNLSKSIVAAEVVGALYCLGIPQTMAILRGLQERGKAVPEPTQYIKAAVQRANGMHIATPAKKEVPKKEEPEEEADDYWAEAVDGGEENWEVSEADLMNEAAALANDYEETTTHDASLDTDTLMAEAASLAEGYEEPEMPKPKKQVQKRVVGGLSGVTKLVPPRATPDRSATSAWAAQTAKVEASSDADATQEVKKADATPAKAPLGGLPVTPQEKMVQNRNYALKCGLELDEMCLKALTRLPFYRAKDIIDEVVLGGRWRTGVANPSRYIILAVGKQHCGLGVEQGIAMELAVSLGVVLNNDCLDELASLPRKESHALIRKLSKDAAGRRDIMTFIKNEVQAARANTEARPFGK
eukprot:TRINITY_DN5423_c0_g1_i1.p1 TRINITY_DN5423_c0_g1~~TRINITY_DN5423_c0_g1_i1.p1  ORF type:complete len:1037 (-),score=241.77 TRINITY_DN5423_c0_g1_i1:190-3249(-)